MTHRLYHIGFMFPGVPKIRDLEPTFSSLGDWVRYSQTGWLLWTERKTIDVLNVLSAAIDRSDNVFVSRIDESDFLGRQPQWIWDWLKTKMPGEVVTADEDPNAFAGINALR